MGIEPPEIDRYWGAEDAHGHRYMAQLADGKDRWLLPLPRAEWEQLWAALCKANPEWTNRYGSGQNFLRQVIGQVMSYILENGDWRDDPAIDAIALEHSIKQWDITADRIRSMIAKVADDSLPKSIRLKAVEILLSMDESEVLAVNKDATRERLHEYAHAIELGV